MTKKQIAYLKLLGYEKTQEDGAILQNFNLCGMAAYVWKGEKFENVMKNYSKELELSLRRRIALEVRKG